MIGKDMLETSNSNLGVVQRTKQKFRRNLERVENHGVNCIPSPFKFFRNEFPGVEQKKYYLVSGAAKSAKTQLTSLLFLYTPLLYAYYNPDKVRIKIFYFNLEESDERITARFMSYLLYTMANPCIRKSPMDLESIIEGKPITHDILDVLDTTEFNNILDFYQSHVEWGTSRNPTGCWRQVSDYAKKHGTIYEKYDKIKDKMVPDYYVPNDKEEYVIIIWDHAGLTRQERDKESKQLLSLKESIDKLSSYFVDFRDFYHYTPVLIQQQNADTISLEAYRYKKIMPTLAGLADTKNTGKDCNLLLGITNPHAFEIGDYRGYNTQKLGGWCRFVEAVMNRDGESNGYLPLYFDGAVNYFEALPKFGDERKLEEIYRRIAHNTAPDAEVNTNNDDNDVLSFGEPFSESK